LPLLRSQNNANSLLSRPFQPSAIPIFNPFILNPSSTPSLKRLGIIGGGPAGFFAAIRCAELNPNVEITILEKTARVLTKVAISGGGRCNVTNICSDPSTLVQSYPRGFRELRGPLTRFNTEQTRAWFEDHHVPLKVEPDGRVFPISDDSRSIVDCLTETARRLGIQVLIHTGVERIGFVPKNGYMVTTTRGESHNFDRLLCATGGLRNDALARSIEALGHSIAPLAPSLFTFNVSDKRILRLSGVSVDPASVSIPGTKLTQTGPLLITHRGFSGPAILKLSAWGARELQDRNYQFDLSINWTNQPAESVRTQLQDFRQSRAKQFIRSNSAWGLPKRLWETLVLAAGINDDTEWNQIPKPALIALHQELTAASFKVTGKNTNKDEFVTCGGINTKEVHFKTQESRICHGLYFAGESLDIDGITGGYNLQAAWTTGFIAGEAIAHSIEND